MSSEKEITLDICKLLPKAELHRHLDGSIRLSTMIELAKEQNIELPAYEESELAKYVLKDKDCHSLPHFLEAFQYTLRVMQTSNSITRIFYEMCEDALADGVTYLEVRFSPILHTNSNLSLPAVMEAVCDGLALAEIRLPIKARIIVCGLRHLDPSVTMALAEVAWRYRHKGVAGFDIAGAENGNSAAKHKEAFTFIRNKGINLTLHSGEDSNWQSVADSIHECGSHRIGHGLKIDNDQLLNFMVDRGIPIECCLTSNLQIKGIETVAHHPIRRYFDKGAIVALCCDNVTMSNIKLSGEYKLAIDTFKFTVEEVIRLIDHSFASTFLDPPLKSKLRCEAVKKAICIFRDHGYDLTHLHANRDFYLANGIDVNLPLEFPFVKLPDVTIEMIKQLPKTDLHSRLDGSVSIDQMWSELQEDQGKLHKEIEKDFGLTIQDIDGFKKIIQNPQHTPETIKIAKSIMNQLLQSKEQLERAVDDIVTRSIGDNVKYMELVFRPASHIEKGLSKEEALNIITSKVREWNDGGKVKIGVVLYVTSTKDDPVEFFNMANLAVSNRNNGVCGFGVFGSDIIPPSELKYFKKTFDYLKHQCFNLVQFSGRSDIESMGSAIHSAGAARLSGAFQVHKFPRMMSYLSNYKIPVEVSMTEKLKIFTADLSFTTPIRHMLDMGILLAICSFKSSLYTYTRNEMLYEIVVNSQLNLEHVLVLLGSPFTRNFQSLKTQTDLKKQFNLQTNQYLQSIGVDITKLQKY